MFFLTQLQIKYLLNSEGEKTIYNILGDVVIKTQEKRHQHPTPNKWRLLDKV